MKGLPLSTKQLHLGDLFHTRRERGQPGLPVFSVTVNDGLIRRDTLERKTNGSLAPEDHLLIRKGDIAYNMMRMWQGASGLAECDGIISPAYVVVTPKNGIDPLFAAYWFKSARMIHLFWAYSYGITGDRLRLYYKDFARIPVTVPPKPEQERIGRMLATMDRTIDQTNRLIAAKRKLKQGLAQQLLTGKRRLPEFSKPWNSVSLSDVARINPSTRKPSCPDEQVSFLAMANIGEGGGTLNPQVRPFREVASGFTSFQDGDVLVAKITPCFENFKGALVRSLKNGLGFGTTELHVIRARDNACPEFLFYLTMSEPFRERGDRFRRSEARTDRVLAKLPF